MTRGIFVWKPVVAVGVVSLLLTACQDVQLTSPERRSTELEIRQHIVGEWTVADKSDGCLCPKLLIAADGSLYEVVANGMKERVGTWGISGSLLRVTPTPVRLEAARVAGLALNACAYYPVIFADDHELVLTPGLSVAGRWRYKK